MRGTQGRELAVSERIGIIPADAGNTNDGTLTDAQLQDHPRGCGEHNTKQAGLPVCGGSSPRMRGTQHHGRRSAQKRRIIPADAGNTKANTADVYSKKDHPRGCGEHVVNHALFECRPGSSPRMRGTRLPSLAIRFLVRIIPADAGNTLLRNLRLSGKTDHPRGCGEHPRLSPWVYPSGGSSPRMRGTRTPPSAPCGFSGIIPADAGNTRQVGQTFARYGDHPRGCGEHVWRDVFVARVMGSSPRMRGTQYHRY